MLLVVEHELGVGNHIPPPLALYYTPPASTMSSREPRLESLPGEGSSRDQGYWEVATPEPRPRGRARWLRGQFGSAVRDILVAWRRPPSRGLQPKPGTLAPAWPWTNIKCPPTGSEFQRECERVPPGRATQWCVVYGTWLDLWERRHAVRESCMCAASRVGAHTSAVLAAVLCWTVVGTHTRVSGVHLRLRGRDEVLLCGVVLHGTQRGARARRKQRRRGRRARTGQAHGRRVRRRRCRADRCLLRLQATCPAPHSTLNRSGRWGCGEAVVRRSDVTVCHCAASARPREEDTGMRRAPAADNVSVGPSPGVWGRLYS